MSTFSATSKKPTTKSAEIVPSHYHLDPSTRKWCACVKIGGDVFWGVEWQEDYGEADSDLRCMINNLNYELTDTMADEGFYPDRAIMNEEKYQQSGRTDGLFNGLMTEDVKISDDNSQ